MFSNNIGNGLREIDGREKSVFFLSRAERKVCFLLRFLMCLNVSWLIKFVITCSMCVPKMGIVFHIHVWQHMLVVIDFANSTPCAKHGEPRLNRRQAPGNGTDARSREFEVIICVLGLMAGTCTET